MRAMCAWLVSIVALAGCSGASGGSSSDPVTISGAQIQLVVSAEEGVTAMAPVCETGLDERCDAHDSDCDGRIDEGCANAVDGALVLALSWNSGADLNLVLEGPSEPDDTSAAQGACDESDSRIERSVFRSPADGRYTVRVQHVDACRAEDSDDEEPTTASLALAVAGESTRVFNRQVAVGENAVWLTFDIER